MAISLEQNTPQSLLQALYNGHVDAITLLGDVPRRAEFRTVLGYSALAVVSYPAQLNLGLSSSQLRAIYSGRVTDWAAVGGERGAIDVIAWTPDSSERLAFDSAVLGGSRVTSNAQLVADSNQVVRLIQADKQAIGYLPASEIQPGLRTLEIDGISISSRDPRYLLIVPIILVSSGEPDGNLRKFLDWALRSESQQNMTQYGTP